MRLCLVGTCYSLQLCTSGRKGFILCNKDAKTANYLFPFELHFSFIVKATLLYLWMLFSQHHTPYNTITDFKKKFIWTIKSVFLLMGLFYNWSIIRNNDLIWHYLYFVNVYGGNHLNLLQMGGKSESSIVPTMWIKLRYLRYFCRPIVGIKKQDYSNYATRPKHCVATTLLSGGQEVISREYYRLPLRATDISVSR